MMQILHSQTDHELGAVWKDNWIGNQGPALGFFQITLPISHLVSGGHKTSPGPRRGEKLRVYLSWWASSARMYRTGILMWPFLEKTISSKKFCPFGCYLHCISAEKTWKISQIVSVAQLNETHAKWCQKMIPKEKAKELVQASLTSRFLNTSTTAPSSRSVSIRGRVTLPQTSGILCAWLRGVNSVH
uniref:uncharacterized protein LOC129500169 isoform X3 n=1 Tax=Nyctereutes procyonoides TaxID=34880 RepID=UPI002443F330|nr:uncharacterized protein LOC129500169 isoform X3 [Nyctereutes procyonoides]